MTSDIRGNLLTIINLSSIDISGVATLTLEWENPSTMETDNAQTMIFVADNAYVANNIGKGLNLEAKIVGDSPHEGEDVQVKITAKDDWGNPIPSIYIQHTVQIEVDSSLHYAVTNMFEQFGYDMTNEAGEVLITKSIPAGLNGAAVYVNVIGYNETGYLDSLSFEIPLAEPEIDITLSTGDSNKSFKWKCKVCEYKWKTSPGNRTKKDGTGCPKCAKTGFDPSEPAVYYCMEIYGPDGLWWYKGGITADINRRRDNVESSLNSNDLPLQVKVVSMLNFDCGSDARELETKLLRIKDIRVKTVEKFDGSFELFSVNPVDYAIGKGFLEGKKTTQSSLENFIL